MIFKKTKYSKGGIEVLANWMLKSENTVILTGGLAWIQKVIFQILEVKMVGGKT